jgi:hypothetical protein
MFVVDNTREAIDKYHQDHKSKCQPISHYSLSPCPQTWHYLVIKMSTNISLCCYQNVHEHGTIIYNLWWENTSMRCILAISCILRELVVSPPLLCVLTAKMNIVALFIPFWWKSTAHAFKTDKFFGIYYRQIQCICVKRLQNVHDSLL